MENLKIALALGSGGLCGVAHIGFLKALEENNIKIDMISGTSMGAIVGGLYSSGMTVAEMESVVKNLNKSDIIDLNLFKLIKQGLLGGKRIEKTLNKFLKVKNFEETKIKFFTQAVDLKNGKLVTFEKGSLVEAMRASSAIPGVIAPVYKDNTIYIDGGVLQTIPYNILKEKGADVIIAVNCFNDNILDEVPKNIFSIITNTVNLMQENMYKQQKKLEKNNYDIFCNDAPLGVSPIDINLKQIDYILESGYQSGLKYVENIKEIIKNKKNLSKTLDYSLEM